jgi:hypothetical protein
MGSEASIGDTHKLRREWMCLILAAVTCCAISVESSGVTSHWQKKPGSVSLQVEATFSGSKSAIQGMQVTVRNIGASAVAIDWDACSLTLPSGRTERIIHTGVMYLIAAMPQASTTIPPSGYITETIWPANLATWRKPYLWGLLGEPTWVQERISVPNPTGVLGLFLTWSDSAGKHDGMWTWTIQQEPRSRWSPASWSLMTWICVIVGLLVLGAAGNALPE